MAEEVHPEEAARRTRRPGVARTYGRALKAISPTLSLITSLTALVLSGLSYGRSMILDRDAARRDAVQSELYLQGELPKGPCTEALTTKTPPDCALQISPNDKAMHLLRVIVTYPSAEYSGGRQYDTSLGQPTLGLMAHTNYLWSRLAGFYDLKGSGPYIVGTYPVNIATLYMASGRKRGDFSSYLVEYAITTDPKSHVALPIALVFCGHLKVLPDFLVDPLVPSPIGYADKRSTSVLVNCLENATYFDAPGPGRYTIVTDAAQQATKGVRSRLGVFPDDPKVVSKAPIEDVATFRSAPLLVSTVDLLTQQSTDPTQ